MPPRIYLVFWSGIAFVGLIFLAAPMVEVRLMREAIQKRFGEDPS